VNLVSPRRAYGTASWIVVLRRTADAGDRAGAGVVPSLVADRRDVVGAGADHREVTVRAAGGNHRSRRHGRVGRAVRQPGAQGCRPWVRAGEGTCHRLRLGGGAAARRSHPAHVLHGRRGAEVKRGVWGVIAAVLLVGIAAGAVGARAGTRPALPPDVYTGEADAYPDHLPGYVTLPAPDLYAPP